MASQNRVPLFITRFSLSPRTAPGVQTARLLAPYPDWLQFHWSSGTLKTIDRRSILLENRFIGRCSFLQSPRSVRFMERFAISSWSGYDLLPKVANRLAAKYRNRVSGVYVAPLSEGDARRCLNLVNLIGAPFVLQLWDVLEGDVRNEALRELIDRAHTVFCVSEPLLRDVAALRPDAELLLFSRDPSPYQATPCQQGPLRIVMHGNISSYADGLDLLGEAITLLQQPVEVHYLGSPKILRQARTNLKQRIKVRGFLATQQQLDHELSHAHVAFLPGPRQDPQADLRSRYSIPSRTQDYLALGLPLVGTVHPASATGAFLRGLGLGAASTCTSPRQIAEHLQRLTNPSHWASESARSRDAFAALQNQEDPALRLERAMAQLGPALPIESPAPTFLSLGVQESG